MMSRRRYDGRSGKAPTRVQRTGLGRPASPDAGHPPLDNSTGRRSYPREAHTRSENAHVFSRVELLIGARARVVGPESVLRVVPAAMAPFPQPRRRFPDSASRRKCSSPARSTPHYRPPTALRPSPGARPANAGGMCRPAGQRYSLNGTWQSCLRRKLRNRL